MPSCWAGILLGNQWRRRRRSSSRAPRLQTWPETAGAEVVAAAAPRRLLTRNALEGTAGAGVDGRRHDGARTASAIPSVDHLFKLDRTVAGWSSTTGSRTSNSRGICGILRCRGPRTDGRILSEGLSDRVSAKEMYICMKLVCNMFDQARRMRCV